jgi:hypothetical protein
LLTCEQIMELYEDRQKARGPVINRMERVMAQYNGDIVVPIPEMDKDSGLYVANLLQNGVDQYGSRIASVMPELECPPVNDRTEKARNAADLRKRANLSWWEASKVPVQLRRRARWLVAYACAPVAIRPDFDNGIPKWEPRNPLTCYPAPQVDPDDPRPDDVIFAVLRPLGWLRRRYPAEAAALYPRDVKADTMVTLLEYDSPDQFSLVACGAANYYQPNVRNTYAKSQMLATQPNEMGLSMSLVPGRVTLDRPVGQFDGILGMMNMQAKLMALEVMAVQRGVFPDMYLESRDPNQPAKIVSGPHPGWSGKINEIHGGTVRYESIQPGFQTNQAIDRIERAARIDSGTSPEFGGESSTNIRTGRRGDAVFSAQVEFPLQEAQHMLASSMEEENRSATRMAKTLFGDRTISVYVKWRGAKGSVTYTPSEFDSEYTTVTYPMAGTDVANLTIGLGQLTGTEMMSKSTGRRLHPWIDDPEFEADQIKSEGMEAATLQGLMAKIADGTVPISDAARINELIVEPNVPPYKAIMQAQEEAQTRQAAMAPGPGTPPGAEGVDPLSPAAQPGLALPGQGAEAGITMPEAPPSLDRLGEIMRDLRATAPRQLAG